VREGERNIQKYNKEYKIELIVKFLDRKTNSFIISDYSLSLEKDKNWLLI